MGRMVAAPWLARGWRGRVVSPPPGLPGGGVGRCEPQCTGGAPCAAGGGRGARGPGGVCRPAVCLNARGTGMGVVVLRLLRLFPITLVFSLSSLCTVPYHRGYPDIGKGREWRIG